MNMWNLHMIGYNAPASAAPGSRDLSEASKTMVVDPTSTRSPMNRSLQGRQHRT